MSESLGLDTLLETEISLPDGIDNPTIPDLYIGLKIELFPLEDGIDTDRYHASASRYETGDQHNQIGEQIPGDKLSAWLRHGCERVHQIALASPCHMYNHDLETDHQKPACLEDGNSGTGYVVDDLFDGGDEYARKVIYRPIRLSSTRKLSLQTRPCSQQPGYESQLSQPSRNVFGTLEGTWRLTLRDLKPEYLGLLVEAIDYLNVHSDAYEIALGEPLKFGGRIFDAQVINPLYNSNEIQRIFARAKDTTPEMLAKNDIWREQVRQQCVQELQDCVAATQQRPNSD